MSLFQILNEIINQRNNTENQTTNNTNKYFHNIDKELLDLPVFRYRKVDKIKSKSCSICLEDYKEGDFIPYFHCEHYFHYNCFKDCLSYSNKEGKKFNCPICRQEIMKQSFVNEAKKKRKGFLDRTYSL